MIDAERRMVSTGRLKWDNKLLGKQGLLVSEAKRYHCRTA